MNNMRAFTAFMMLAALAATSGSLSAAEAKRTFKLHQDKPVLFLQHVGIDNWPSLYLQVQF